MKNMYRALGADGKVILTLQGACAIADAYSALGWDVPSCIYHQLQRAQDADPVARIRGTQLPHRTLLKAKVDETSTFPNYGYRAGEFISDDADWYRKSQFAANLAERTRRGWVSRA